MFPSPFPTNNPYTGEAAGFASSAAAALNGTRAAANQRAQQIQQQKAKETTDYQTQLEKDFNNARTLINEGFVPSHVYPNGDPLPGRPTLQTPEDNPAAQGGGPTITDPNGRQYTKKPALDDTNSFVAAPGSDTEKFLQEAANIPPGTRLPFAHVGAVGSLADQMQRASDAAAKKKQVAVVTKDAADKATALGLNIPEGSEVPFGQLNEFMQALQPKEKTPKSLHFESDTGAGVVRGYDPETGQLKSTAPGAGMTAAQTEADKDRHVRQQELEENRQARRAESDRKALEDAAKVQEAVKAKHDALQSAEQDQWDLRGRYADLADPTKNPNGSMVSLPNYNAKTGEITDGQARTMNKDLRASFAQQSQQAERKAMEKQDAARRIRKSMGWGEFASPQGAAPAAATGTAPTPASKRSAPQLPSGQKVGDTVQLKGGKMVKIKQIYTDGTFDY